MKKNYPHFLAIESIEEIEVEIDVYDAEVENTHCFFANDILIHNCLGGQLPKQLEFKKDLYGKAIGIEDINGKFKKEFEWFSKEFDKDFYLELQVWDNGDHFQPILNKFLLDYGKETGAQFVLTADAHYLNKEDEKLHEILMAMQQKMTLQEYKENSELQYGPYFYVASGEEMLERAKSINCEEAFYNTQIIKDKCNVEIPLGKYEEIYYPIDNNLKDYDEFIKWKENNK